MNDIHDAHDDWQALAEVWRQQPGSTIDTAALLREVHRRGRRLRWTVASELATAGFVLVACAWIMLSPGWVDAPRGVIVALMAIVLGFQAWALWIRRGQVREGGLDVNAMIALDIRRTRTTLRYWRVSAWVGLAMWLGLYAVTWSMLVEPSWDDAVMLRKLLHSVVATGFVGLGAAAWAWWWGRRNRLRLARMLRLQDELRQD